METRHAARSERGHLVRNLSPASRPLTATRPPAAADLAPDPSAVDAAPGAAVARLLMQRFGAARFERYFGVAPAVRFGPDGLEIEVPTGFLATLLDRRFKHEVLAAARDATGAAPQGVRFVAQRPVPAADLSGEPAALTGEPAPSRAASPNTALPAAHVATRSRAQRLAHADRHNLAHFAVGPSTRLAYEVAAALASDAPDLPRLVVLHGPCGSGKSHLLFGAALRAGQTRPGALVRALSADQFTTDYVTALRSGRLEHFRSALRNADLLAIDDIGVLATRPATQNEIVLLLDAIAARGGRVLVSAASLPRQIDGLSEPLVSRLMGGVVASVGLPDEPTRAALASRFAARRGIRLEPDAALAIAHALPNSASARDVEGLVVKVEAIHRLLDGCLVSTSLPAEHAIGVGTVRRALDRDSAPRPSGTAPLARQPVRFPAILAAVCERLAVAPEEVLASGRHATVVAARSLCAFVARRATTMSFPEIARALGRPNHSTVITACQRVARQIHDGIAIPLGPQGNPCSLQSLVHEILNHVRGVDK